MHRVDLRHDAFFIVRLIGLEPTQPELPDPKSGASTNFATGAGVACCVDGLRLGIIKKIVLRWACAIVAGAKVVFFWLTVDS